ncbi:Hypothetical predicted protein, partial [Xyrichtys novacula]
NKGGDEYTEAPLLSTLLTDLLQNGPRTVFRDETGILGGLGSLPSDRGREPGCHGNKTIVLDMVLETLFLMWDVSKQALTLQQPPEPVVKLCRLKCLRLLLSLTSREDEEKKLKTPNSV